jgi:hypothetical protein
MTPSFTLEYIAEVAVPHGLGGNYLMQDLLSPVPHGFVVSKEEGMVLKDGSAQGASERVRTFGWLTGGRTEWHRIERCILEVLKRRPVQYVGALLAGRRNIPYLAILRAVAHPLHLHF